MNDRDAWIRFACIALQEAKGCEYAGKVADRMLVELKKRDLDNAPLRVELSNPAIAVNVCFDPELIESTDDEHWALRVVGDR